MSEIQTTDNGTGTVTSEFSAEELAELRKLQAQRKAAKAKAEENKELRRRQNARGKMPDGVTERNASQAWLSVLGQVLSENARVYHEDPAAFLERIEERIIPEVLNMADTASIVMSTTFDGSRRALWSAMPRADAEPVKAPGDKK